MGVYRLYVTLGEYFKWRIGSCDKKLSADIWSSSCLYMFADKLYVCLVVGNRNIKTKR